MTCGNGLSDWVECKLGEVSTLQRGFDITKAEQSPGPYPVVSSSGITSRHSEYKVRGPGVVIGRKGSLGTAFFLPGDFWPHDTTLWVKDFHGNDPKFCFYLLKTLRLEQFDTGAANPTLNRNHIHGLPLCIPILKTQRRIASILSAYDDLIENNTRRIAILEEMARRLYEEWFVRFRFPGHELIRMVESKPDLGLIPEGWETSLLGDLFDFIGGAQPPKAEHRYEALPGFIRFVQNRDYGTSHHLTYIKEGRKNKICGRLDIMVDKYGEAGKTRFGIAGAYNVALAKISPKQSHYREWLRGFISRPEFCEYLASASQAATRASLNSVHFGVPVVIPPDRLLHAFTNQVTPMLELTLIYRDAVSNLRAQRDLLLPKLISGEIDVSAFSEPEAVAA